MESASPAIERHPLEPFVPAGARVLMLGSFPPPRARWCMEFYYPNFQNDMWRILGLVFFGDPQRFVDTPAKRFRREAVVDFCARAGIALYDTATAVRRLRGDASDKFLQIEQPTDIRALLALAPGCRSVAATGQLAAEAAAAALGCGVPPVGGRCDAGGGVALWRLPSSSRAYPLAIGKKAALYRGALAAMGFDIPAGA